MTKESFESLNEYQSDNLEKFVPESLLLEKDSDGTLGKVIDRGLSFVPRAMRFKKAKSIMQKNLVGFTKKAKNLINKFAKSFKKKVDIVEKEYETLKEEKIKPLVNDGHTDQAVKMMKEQLKEIESYKKEQMQILDKGIQDILDAYTSSIHHRIDNPGFVLNVELSEKGKGELKAKWQELIALQRTKVDEAKTALIKSEGWKKLDDMISEMTAFIESKGRGANIDVDFLIQDVVKKGAGEYVVKVHLRVSGGRPSVKEKGVIVGDNPEDLALKSGAKRVKEVGEYQYNARPYTLLVRGNDEDYVRPYMVIKDTPEPFYGDIASLGAGKDDTKPKTKEEEKKERIRGDERIIGGQKKPGGSLSDEEPMAKN